MRIRSSINRERDLGDSQTMTPMIDIVFLLLVFFVCVATDRVVEHDLPTELAGGGVTAESTEQQDSWITEIRVKVYPDAAAQQAIIEMNGRQFDDEEQFRQTLVSLADVSRESPVILDIGSAVEVGDVIKVYDACRAAKFTSINFAMRADELAG